LSESTNATRFLAAKQPPVMTICDGCITARPGGVTVHL